MSNGSPHKGRGIAVAFALSALASLALTVVYAQGGQPQLEGVLLGVALGGIALGLTLWAKHLMPGGDAVQERHPLGDEALRHQTEEEFEGQTDLVGRRSFLAKMLAGAVGALGLAALLPIRSLGQSPGDSLERTKWTPGARVVTKDGLAVAAADLDVGAFITVFPAGHTDAADSQVILLRVDPGSVDPLAGREDWSPDGFMAFSKICTHAGCPIGLYQPATGELFCPCHQSVFAVDRAAEPTDGPATRPLPQLPLAIDEAGYLIATGDFSAPVGPGYWSLG
jgi:quinol---cytochrome c reductase iron-sulfur subunit